VQSFWTPLRVGLVVALGVAAFGFGLYLIGAEKFGTDRTYLVYAIFDDATGLGVRSRVQIAGIPIGQVERVELDQQRAPPHPAPDLYRDRLHHAGFGLGERRKNVNDMIERDAVGDPGTRVDAAFLDQADAVAFGVVEHGDRGPGLDLGAGLDHLGPQALGLLERGLDAGHGDVEGDVLVGVVGGGCSGFSYTMSFDKEQKADDRVVEVDGVRVLVDAASLEYLAGTTLDYVSGLHGSGFKFVNPKATRTCGCGESFGV